MIVARNIQKSYGQLKVLKGIDLTINRGQVVSITGPSGAGKSTLLHILGTLDFPDQGTVELVNTATSSLKGNKLAAFRNKHIGFVFQFHHLLPEFTAIENVCIPAWIAKTDKATAQKTALELLNIMGLSDRANHKPDELSGGEQQRIAVARALMNQPDILFADEPSGNLDSRNAEELHQLFFELRDKYNQTIVLVTHNNELAQMADRQIVLRDGKIEKILEK